MISKDHAVFSHLYGTNFVRIIIVCTATDSCVAEIYNDGIVVNTLYSFEKDNIVCECCRQILFTLEQNIFIHNMLDLGGLEIVYKYLMEANDGK